MWEISFTNSAKKSYYDEIAAEKINKIGKGAMALKGARARENFSQKELSEKLGIDRAIIYKIENGEIKISTQISKQLSNLFNIDYKIFLK